MISVTVAFALPDRQEVLALRLEDGSTVGDALARADPGGRFPEVDPKEMRRRRARLKPSP